MEDDTIKLLRECNAGIKMGIASLDDVLESVESEELRNLLKESRETHCRLGSDSRQYLERYQEEGKEPAAMARMMSWLKATVKLEGDDVDEKAADLITDGCNMGIKSLHRYLNQYPAAEKRVKKLAGELIDAEETLVQDLRAFL